ncbi:MAG: PEP-CTERM sorting domain-containing protein [Nitrospinales bacterium]
MKKLMILASVFLLACFISGSASAVNFSVDAGNSSLVLSNVNEGDWFLGGSNISAALSTYSNPYTVPDGSAYSFEFGTITLAGFGLGALGSADIQGTLALITGDAPYVNSGDGWWLTVIGGVIDAGGLWWGDNPGIITLANGNWFDVRFEDIGFGVSICESTYDVMATVTGHSVPEPENMMLLGAGLIGLAVIGRKKFFK